MLQGGHTCPGSHEQGLLRSNASEKAESKLYGCFTPGLLRAFLHENTFWSSRKDVFSKYPGHRDHILWIFIFFPKGPEFPERLLCSINPVTSADSGRCCGRGGLRESRKVSRAEGGWQPQAARVVGSLLLGHAAQQDQPAVLLGCLI